MLVWNMKLYNRQNADCHSGPLYQTESLILAYTTGPYTSVSHVQAPTQNSYYSLNRSQYAGF